MLESALYNTLLTDHRLQPPRLVAGECLSYFIKPLQGQRFTTNKAIRPYGFINKGMQRECYITIWCKKHLPKKIIPLSVPFFGSSCLSWSGKLTSDQCGRKILRKVPELYGINEPKFSLPSLPKASALIVFNDGRNTTELMRLVQ